MTDPKKTWPYDDRYLGGCIVCQAGYFGPKRSRFCWECVSNETKQWWREQNGEKQP